MDRPSPLSDVSNIVSWRGYKMLRQESEGYDDHGVQAIENIDHAEHLQQKRKEKYASLTEKEKGRNVQRQGKIIIGEGWGNTLNITHNVSGIYNVIFKLVFKCLAKITNI